MKEDPTHQDTAKQKIPAPFRLLPQITDYEPHYNDPQDQGDPVLGW